MTTAASDEVQLRVIRDALRHRWPVIAAIVLVVTAAAGVLAFRMSPSYTAQATVLLRPLPGNALDSDSTASSQQIEIAMETEAGLASSPEVAGLVGRPISDRVADGTSTVDVTVPANTETVSISFTAHSPVAAREGAQAYADGFLAFRSDRAKHTNKQQLSQLRKQSKEAEKDLKSASEDAKSKTGSASASAKVHLYANRVSSLEGKISELKVVSSDPGIVVTPATTPTGPDGLAPWMYALAAGLLSLVAGFAVAVWRERSGDVVRPDTDTSVAGVPVLTVLPARRHGIADDADSATKDAYRRARVGALAHVKPGSVITICDVSEARAAAEVTANLGMTLRDAGHRVALVDATLEGHALSRLMGKDRAPGLSDVLAARGEAQLNVSEAHGMRFLPAGTVTEQAQDLYAGEEFKLILGNLKANSDIVLVLAPPTGSPENDAIALCTDGLIIVATEGRTTHAEIDHVRTHKSWLGISLIGCVCAPRRRSSRRRTQSTQSQHQVRDAVMEDDPAADGGQQSIPADR